ncbi:MAG: hypothetical protein WAN14_21230, partial [Candidatus Acidiferrales bacterium]
MSEPEALREAAYQRRRTQLFRRPATRKVVALLGPDAFCGRSAILPWTIWRRRWKRCSLLDCETLEYIANL